ncbi:MAG: hypothetical protein RL375_934 [Pseudomonadota bacterium]|jgi:hypothetical protein
MEVKIVEYNQTAAALGELRQRYENVLFPVDTTAGMKDAVAARKHLRDIRVGLEKMRKEIKAPALERCQLIDSEAKAITAQLEALEDPIDHQIKAEEARKEREKQERERIERERVAAIRAKIDRIGSIAAHFVNSTAQEIGEAIADLEEYEVTEERYSEFVADATVAKDHALRALRAMRERQVAQEAEATRVAAERAELERLRAEAAERDRQAAAERAAQEAALRAEREELERMRAEIDAAKKPAPVVATPDQVEVAPASVEPVESQFADVVTHGVAITKMEYDDNTGAVISTTVSPSVFLAPAIATPKAEHRPSDDDIIDVLSLHFRVHESKVIEWLLGMDLEAASARMLATI